MSPCTKSNSPTSSMEKSPNRKRNRETQSVETKNKSKEDVAVKRMKLLDGSTLPVLYFRMKKETSPTSSPLNSTPVKSSPIITPIQVEPAPIINESKEESLILQLMQELQHTNQRVKELESHNKCLLSIIAQLLQNRPNPL